MIIYKFRFAFFILRPPLVLVVDFNFHFTILHLKFQFGYMFFMSGFLDNICSISLFLDCGINIC